MPLIANGLLLAACKSIIFRKRSKTLLFQKLSGCVWKRAYLCKGSGQNMLYSRSTHIGKGTKITTSSRRNIQTDRQDKKRS